MMSLYQENSRSCLKMLRIITDTASDITIDQAKEMNIDVASLEITFEDGTAPQRTEADFQRFYERLETCEKLPVTSRTAPEEYLKVFWEAKAAGDDVLVITLSSGLSGTIDSARMAKEIAGYDRIEIVDSQQAILTQRMLVEYAVKLREEGYQLQEIARRVREMRGKVVVCGVVDTLKFLQKGGRIPASLAAVGTLLRIKPVIVLEDKILKQLGKARGHEAGVAMLCKRMEQDGFNKAYPVYFGYTSNREMTEKFMQETKERYGLTQTRMFPIGGVIGTHCGTNCVAVAYVKC